MEAVRIVVALVALFLALSSSGLVLGAPAGPSVIIVGAGMSGISAGKTLSDAGIKNLLILEATDRIGGRIRNTNFAGINVEVGANWVEGVNGPKVNPIWEMANRLNLTRFYAGYGHLSSNTYKESGGRYGSSEVEGVIDEFERMEAAATRYSEALPPGGNSDISVLTSQRLQNNVPSTPLEMVVDYYNSDYEFAEPPRVTSLQNTVPLPTFSDFGDDVYFVADQLGYESIVHDLASQFLRTARNGTVIDPRLRLRKVVRRIQYSPGGVAIFTEDGWFYKADYVLVSVSIGVLQTKLIKFEPVLPNWKILAIYQFDMSVYTKIFLKFPSRFWPHGNGTEFFLYASERRGYYPIWQHFEREYPGANVLLVTVTDEESRRIEQQADLHTMAECMEVLRNMFGPGIPEGSHILVPRWWSDRFFKGTFSNWPLGVNRYEYDQIRAPVGRLYFTGEHTSTRYNGYVHGAYLAGIDSANIMIDCITKKLCKYQIKPKDS